MGKSKGESAIDSGGATSLTPNVSSIVQHTFSIDSFDVSTLQWNRWVRRLESAFTVFRVVEDLKVAYLVHYMGAEVYEILCDKCAPEDPREMEFKNLIGIMQQYYNPQPLEIAENFRFSRRNQQEGETVQEYVTALQKLAL